MVLADFDVGSAGLTVERSRKIEGQKRIVLYGLSCIAVLSAVFIVFNFAFWRDRGLEWYDSVPLGIVLALDFSCLGLWRTNPRQGTDTGGSLLERVGFLGTLYWCVSIVTATVVLLAASVLGLSAWANWSAERDARRFCDETPIGSDISAATARADDRKLMWGAGGKYYHDAPVGEGSPYTFYFFGAVMDKAVCEVSFDRKGKVRTRHSEMEYD